VFKALWYELVLSEDAPGLNRENVVSAIGSKPTIAWPNNAEFETAIRSGNLYQRKAVNYALAEYELACEGETPQDGFQIEHIAPQKPTEYWVHLFGDRYEELLNTWANLIPVTGRMNNEAGQAPYESKSEEYTNSIFASARQVSSTYPVWSPLEVDQRADAICGWAITRWPHEPPATQQGGQSSPS
jgi:hypothetical protein